MRAIIPQLLFVLFVLDVRNVGVDKERVALKPALKEQNLFLLQIDRFELLETSGKVSLLLDFRLLHVLDLTLLLSLQLLLPLLLLLVLLLDLLLDDAQIVYLLLAGLAVDYGTRGVEVGFG